MELFVGIEAVGMSFSVAAIANSDGKIISAVRSSPFSLHASGRGSLREGLIRLINSLLGDKTEDINWSKITMCVGLTGVTFPYDAKVVLPDELSRIGVAVPRHQLVCTGDAEIITAAYTQAETAAAIISHMGSTAYVYQSGTSHRCGGWGPQLGDEGSAFAIGRSAVQQMLSDYDNGLPCSRLWQFLSKWLDRPLPARDCWTRGSHRWKQCMIRCREDTQDERTALFSLAHSLSLEDLEPWRCLVAGLAIPVMQAWNSGDETADKIIKTAAQSLASQLSTLMERTKIQVKDIPLVLYGGLLRYHPDFRKLMFTYLFELCNDQPALILPPEHSSGMRPVCGALLFALGGSTGSNLKLPSDKVVETMRRSSSNHDIKLSLHNE